MKQLEKSEPFEATHAFTPSGMEVQLLVLLTAVGASGSEAGSNFGRFGARSGYSLAIVNIMSKASAMIVRETFTDREAVSRKVLSVLPEWFGIPAAREGYICHATSAPMFIAETDDQAIGYASLAEHYGTNCEVHSMGVHPEWHRKGVGRGLIEASAHWAKVRGFRWLSVKTLSDRHPDLNYAKTRRFYGAMGFLPFEEIPSLWGNDLPCLVLIRPLSD